MSQRIPFTKGHGTGNDFVIVPDEAGQLDLSDEQVIALCDRRFGIGADGILRVTRAEDGRTWFMDHRNADGSTAEMCGNGIRLFVHYLVETGLESGEQPVTVLTRAGIRIVTKTEHGYRVDLGQARVLGTETRVHARGLDVPRPGSGVDVGNPHVVVALSSIDELDRLDLTAVPQMDPAPEHGANVEFVVPAEPLVQDGVGTITMRVFERGVGETQSCGTGVAAAALAVQDWAGSTAPDRWLVRIPGGQLRVQVTEQSVFLEGPATLVFSGEITLAGAN